MHELINWIQTHGELTFVILLSVNAALTAFVILLENREPEKSIAWFLALLVFPFVGFIVYLFFGRDWHKRSYRQRRLSQSLTFSRRQELKPLADRLSGTTPLERTVRLLDATLTGFDPTEGNRITILTDADEAYPRLFAALRSAKRTIDIEYYIFRDDATGMQVLNILKERAKSGVTVRLLVDGMGSFGLGRRQFPELRAAGVSCHYFFPLITLFYFLKANYRDHRKIVVIDGEVAYTGGINIGDEYLGKSSRGNWRDTSVELRGPAASQLTEVFEESWDLTTGDKPTRGSRTHALSAPEDGKHLIDVVPSGPANGWKAIHQQYLALIQGAAQRIRIQTPYFIPDESLVSALTLAALRGVEVEIMIPRYPDWPYLRWVAHTYLEDLLRAGVRIYEFETGFLHTKAFIVDDTVASLGTCNVDIRSLRLDFEVNILLSSPEAVRHLTEDFERDLVSCKEIAYKTFIERSLLQRTLESIARLISPLL